MPKQYYTIRDWSGGINNKKDPRDIAENEMAYIQDMSIDALGKLKTNGGMYAIGYKQGGSGTLSEYIVERTAALVGGGGYGLAYFESDHSRDNEQTIVETLEFTDSTCDYNHTGGSPRVVAHDSNSKIVAGLVVSGTGVAGTIASIDSSTQFTLSADTTATATDGTLTFTRALALGTSQTNGNIAFIVADTHPDAGVGEGPSPE